MSWFNGSKVCGLYNLGVAKKSQERFNKIGLCLEFILYIYNISRYFLGVHSLEP